MNVRASAHTGRRDDRARRAGGDTDADGELRLLTLPPNGWVPNNAALAVVVYRHAFDADGADADELGDLVEQRFASNGWPVQWRDSVFDYHHFHASAHEVMGVLAGSAEIMLGGPNGYTVRVAPGDVLLLPAGTGHCLMTARGGFKVAGGYPCGQQWDIRRDALSPEELREMQALPFPHSDPVFGERGPVIDNWVARRQ